jgi:DNA-binding NarL/FixJ family response regulator
MRPETLLELLQPAPADYRAFIASDLRRFACWCARDAGAAEAGAIPYRVVHAAEKAAAGQLPLRLLAAERRSAVDLATAAGTLGVRQRNWTSAVALAAIVTADDDQREAARGAAHYAALAAVLRDGAPAGIVMRIRLAAALRFFIPNPFTRDASMRGNVA